VAMAALLAAFAAVSLITTNAVSRRDRELGTLKALGWRSRRIVSQILAESAVVGVLGATAGVALGFAAETAIDAAAPTLTAASSQTQGADPRVAVHLSAHLTVGTVLLSVLLALAGALSAGALGAWRSSQMRPADALSQPH
jgi:putative ABC transport system permease protein